MKEHIFKVTLESDDVTEEFTNEDLRREVERYIEDLYEDFAFRSFKVEEIKE